jgi:hypothetical protein
MVPGFEAREENGNLVIKIPLSPPRDSSTGKTKIVASTGGNITTTVMVQGKPVKVSLNAIIAKD